MTKLLVLAAVATLMLSGSASAEDVANSNRAADGALKQMLNCHPPVTGKPAWDSQPIEKSVILPSAGGGTVSAAPSVQRHGLPVEVRSDCPPPIEDDPKAKGAQ